MNEGALNMKENNTVFDKIIFALECSLVLFVPFVILWSFPTAALNSDALYRFLEAVGVFGHGCILLAGIPAGVIGIIKAKRMVQLRKPTLVLSIINISAGSIELLMWLLVFCAVIFGGVTH